MKKRMISAWMTLCLLLTLCTPFSAAAANTLETAVEHSAKYMLSTVKEPQVSSTGGEWAIIGLARSSYEVPQKYWDSYYATAEAYVKDCKGVLHTRKYTEYARVSLALTAIGADPRNVAGYDLLKPLGDFEKTTWQGINGPIWALIALDAGGYEMPENPEATIQATRQMYVDQILSRQLSDGGWSLTGTGSGDPDITGMALQALSKYQSQAKVQTAIEKAVTFLSRTQEPDGGYSSYSNSSSESIVQVIVGLCEVGMDLEDSRFVKNGNTLLDSLLSCQQSNGSFLHTSAGSGSSQMASEQGLYGIVAALRSKQGKSSLYRMDDVTLSVSGVSQSIGLEGKHADVKRIPITAPGTTFTDISGHKNRVAIEALAARGILNGKGNSLFDPNSSVTRAQFAAIVIRALGLPEKAVATFPDVTGTEWFAPTVGAANTYGIVNGRTDGRFDPYGTISRQEAAVMVARAAKLCGMDTELESYEILNTLAQFGDYVTIGQWARESMAFCYSENILDQSDLNVEPYRPILRCEIAQMIYGLLDGAELL